ncbi:MAG TPA: PGF-pre-PGF domain-containing protein, partial [Bacteroidales bacterium]|nr:PGF-pre-PGF domain-containing protein [Bacteroidales bacterium]
IRVKPNVGSSKLQFYVRAALRDSSGSVVRVPASSGDMDQEGWYVDEHSIDVIEEVTEAPSPVIDNVDSEAVYDGDTATITVSVINEGGPSNEGYIVVSFPDNEEVTDVSGTGNEYNKLFPIGSTVHGKKGSMTSINPVAGLYESNWESDQTERLTIKVKPNAGSSKIEFYVRATLKDGSGDDIRTPSSSAYTDQQGWYVESNSIDVLSSVDLTPPASVTKLKLGESGSTWIRWTWTNPSDADFSHVMVYIDGAFATTTSNNYYELTGLTEGSTHTIALQTVDTTGNINSDIVNDEATTSTTLPEITNVKGEDASTSSITLVWKDTTRVEIFRDTVFIGDVSGSTSYVDSGLDSGTSYSYKLVPYNSNGLKGNAVNVNLKTLSSSDSGDPITPPPPSSDVTPEDPANVAVKDVAREYLTQNSNALYEFSREGNDIQSVSFDSLQNSGQITATVEVLNGRSKRVTSDPTGFVYKYINVWVGEEGFDTDSNIQNAKINFKVDNAWLEAMGFNSEEVKLQVYSGDAWQELSTTLETNNGECLVFEAKTTIFGPFAITAEEKILPSPPGPDDPIPPDEPETGYMGTFIKAFVLIGIVAVGYSYLKRD